MSEKHWVDDKHYRLVSDDGKKSWLMESSPKILGIGPPDIPLEVSEHHSDGTTDAYEYDGSLVGSLVFGNKGRKKQGAFQAGWKSSCMTL
ncbi:MAG: hypothetical protein ACO1TE_12960 [Prosthecobacter sp.]